MKAKVRNYKLIANYFDSFRGASYTKQSTGRELNIYFDEGMYIDHGSCFMAEFLKLFYEKYTRKAISESLMVSIEQDVNFLLEKYRAMGVLFLDSDKFIKDESFTVLNKDELFDFY